LHLHVWLTGPVIQSYISLLAQTLKKAHELRKSAVRKTKILVAKINKHLNSFHALHSSLKMERMDYVFKFSTEIVVAALSLVIIAVNAVGPTHLVSASAPISKFLALHSDRNLALYSKTTTVKTVVAQDNGNILIPSVSAQVVLASTDAVTSNANESAASTATVSDNSLQQQYPDSMKTAIADQIKVYDTKPGDTLASIAQKYGLQQNTIIWANNLPNSTIKPGWNLVILPTDGILHKVTDNDSLQDIAKKYHADLDKIIAYNGLADESDIQPGDLIIVPGGTVPQVAKPKAPVAHKVGNKVVYEPAPGDITDIAGEQHSFPRGQCTYYVAQRRNIPWGGNAKTWDAHARAYGVPVGNTPAIGAIAVSHKGRYGHVAIVEEVRNDGTFVVAEMNFEGFNKIDRRVADLSDFTRFIY
jgi:surface antigen